MFDCPNEKCGKKAERLIASAKGLGCDHCQTVENRSFDGLLHKVRISGPRAGNQRITHADAMRIKTNRKRSDGQFRPDPRWRTTGD